MSSPKTLHANEERAFHVRLMPCIITKQFDKCICMKLSEVQPIDEAGEPFGRPLEVWGQFSAAGLRSMLQDLEEATDPVGLPTPDEIRNRNPYGWGVVFADGREAWQYNEDGSENPFATIHLPDVRELWVLPRPGHMDLPRYGLVAEMGFFRIDPHHGLERLDLPYPDWPYHWHYYRRNWITFSSFGGQSEYLPERVIQVLGWRIEDEGEDVLLEIGIEADGTWHIFKKEPWDHSGFVPPQAVGETP